MGRGKRCGQSGVLLCYSFWFDCHHYDLLYGSLDGMQLLCEVTCYMDMTRYGGTHSAVNFFVCGCVFDRLSRINTFSSLSLQYWVRSCVALTCAYCLWLILLRDMGTGHIKGRCKAVLGGKG